MTRLTNYTRDKITAGLLAHRFKPAVQMLEVEQRRLAKLTYEDCFPAAVRKRMDDLPKGWLREQLYSRVQVGSEVTQLNFNGQINRYDNNSKTNAVCPFVTLDITPIYRRVPSNKYGETVKIYGNAPGDEIGYAVHQYLRSRETLSDEIKSAERQIIAALSKFSNIANLVKEWPEIEPFIPAPQKPAPQLPAVPVAALNGMLGLPVS